jgi:guanylate kinase
MADPVTARRGLMLILTSPSGAGKSTLTRQLLAEETDIALSVSVTTRARRKDEIDGVHYLFIDRAAFERMREANELLEWAEVHGNCYGTPRRAVEEALSAGKDVLFDIDVAGVRQLAAMVREDMATVFLLPPSVAEQIARLKRRASDDEAAILKRLRTARDEIGHWGDFDYILVNDDLGRAFAELKAILHAERLKQRRRPKLEALIAELGRDLDVILGNGRIPG